MQQRHYNAKRLHSAIGYITPLDKLKGNAEAVFSARKKKLKHAQLTRLTMYKKAICK